MMIKTDPGVVVNAPAGIETGPAVNAGAPFLVASYEVAARTVKKFVALLTDPWVSLAS
jgi:hypothetical protein